MSPSNGSTIYVDNTLLSAVARCDTAAVLRHGLGLDSPMDRAVLRSGQDLHEAMAVYLRTKDPTQALAHFDARYQGWAMTNVTMGDRLGWANARAVLAEWIRTHDVDLLPIVVHPDFVEVGFAFPLTPDGRIVYVGRLDVIGTGRQDGWWYVMDHKFAGRLTDVWHSQWLLDSQVTGYVWAARQHVGKQVVGMYINGVELSKLPSDPVRKCRKHAVTFAECGPIHAHSEIRVVQRTPAQLALWQQGAVTLADRFLRLRDQYPSPESFDANLLMQGMWNHSCPWCPFRDGCSTGRNPAIIHNLYTYNPWEPYERLTADRQDG